MTERPQALTSSSFLHFPEVGEVHGPVLVFIADDGRIVFFCPTDKATWELTPGARRSTLRVTDALGVSQSQLG